MTKYPIDTINYVEGQRITQRLDTSRKLARIEARLDVGYLSGVAATILHDGDTGSLINDFRIGGKGFSVFEADGWDLYYICWLLNKRMPDMVPYTAAAGAKVARATYNIPVQIAPGQLRNVNLTVIWGVAADIGADQTVPGGATLNGNFEQNDNPVANQRIVPAYETNTTGQDHTEIDDAGRLTGALIITRANATPFALRDFIDHLSLRINGVYPVVNIDWETMQSAFLEKTGTDGDYIAGIGFLDLSDEIYVPKEGSRFEWEGDATASDVAIYQIFEPVATNTQEKTATVSEQKPIGGGSGKAGANNAGGTRKQDLGIGRGSTGLGLGI